MATLKGKKAIVTGGAMGIGLATARLLLKNGCDVTIWDMNEKALASAKKELINMGLGRMVYTGQCDVTDNKKVIEMSKKAIKDMGTVDILINNAGIERHGKFAKKPITDWVKVIDVNIKAVMYVTHAILPQMYKQNSGHIVNISSAAGLLGVADMAAYCASKWGVWGFSESLRQEFIDDKINIKCSSVHPHFVKEGLFAGSHLNWLGELMVPRIKNHEVVAKKIVNKALKKRRNTVKIPVTLQLPVFLRGTLPDFILVFLAGKLFGVSKGMADWVGHDGEKK